MNSIHDITDYIILRVKSEDRFASLINLKLQKLLYYVQAWSYGINKKPMFDGEFEAWIHGPVNREIYNRFNSTKYLYSEINIDDCMNHNVSLSSEDAEFIDFILENYLKYSGAELERLSHNEMPWIETRGDLNVNERCDKVITPELMIEYYGKNGKLLNLNSDSPKYGNKSLVTKEQENELKRRKITFSFSYFKQIPNFQIGECSKGWHIGLLERLGALGTMTPQEVLEENRGSIALRCHPIDWSAKNIPIQRKDLDWLPKEILDNETDFPIMQFSITKSTGRIVGYFDRDSSIFHIVLLDPEHNIQPAKKTNYQIQPTTKGYLNMMIY